MLQNNITSIRKRLGLSQQHLADYLNLDRSVLSLIEKGTRQMPSEMLSKLLELENTINGTNKRKQTQPVFSNELQGSIGVKEVKLRKRFTKQADDCLYRVVLLNIKLDVMLEQYSQTINLLSGFDYVSKNLNKNDTRQKLWLQLQRDNAEKKLLRCDVTEQLKIKAAIAILEFKARTYQEMQPAVSDV